MSAECADRVAFVVSARAPPARGGGFAHPHPLAEAAGGRLRHHWATYAPYWSARTFTAAEPPL
jgi:hypothetical protein